MSFGNAFEDFVKEEEAGGEAKKKKVSERGKWSPAF